MLNFDDRVQNIKYKMTLNEEELTDYIKKNIQSVSQMKIVTLANELCIAPNTITRFCTKLGYENFSELKLCLKYETEDNISKGQRYILNKNFDLIDTVREKKVADMMAKARAVNFYALEQTGLLLKVSVNNFYVWESKFQIFEYQNEIETRIKLNSDEIFFFVSLTGENQYIIELAKHAKNNNHKVISLTDLSDNTLSKISDVSLYCYTKNHKINDYDVTDKTPIMIIMYSLFLTFCKI
ncbi:MurR/RpiR family transcriptional regulator [Lactococcus protaetiae]|uniref:MurR/RpiR family transcriptional regulator n=1 Tax=Lactococcus protaetiae TaxID=2592653 RepID=A0A514Z9L9_9LACT|nr:MurR/RpiR family transcriptional regulator [Lactococcus protaetiae]QDK71289.1 MurR/RpiR family transcriptional regulator [Lactococcus protaetiae]